jgi:hypothetical protein
MANTMLNKHLIKKRVLKIFEVAGRYKPFTESELQCVQREAVWFVGDLPDKAGKEFNQYRIEFKIPRVPQEVRNLLYTPRGMGWVDGAFYQRYSLREPALRDLFVRPSPNAASPVPQGTVVQAETPATYGDWVSEHLVSLVTALPICPPLLMPKHLMDKSYVRRDLALLGIETVAVERPVLVHKAVVLPKRRFSHYWTADEVEAYRRALHIEPIQPRPGSILYISREGEQSEGTFRNYPSELTAGIMTELGARVVLARQTSYEEYLALAEEAETVIADHGSAMCNLLFWNTRNVIELFNEQWWNGCFLFLAKALGIENYALIRVDNIDRSELRCRIIHHLKCFGS